MRAHPRASGSPPLGRSTAMDAYRDRDRATRLFYVGYAGLVTACFAGLINTAKKDVPLSTPPLPSRSQRDQFTRQFRAHLTAAITPNS
ncbi:MAG: hypothetical protein ACSLFR_11900 [Solirubrobacteraceae bacterium]